MGDDWFTPLPGPPGVQSRNATLTAEQWPATLAPIAQILERGLDLAQATVVSGENGTGKSTFVEAVAIAYGLSPEGGSAGAEHSTPPSESSLSQAISLVRVAGASRWSYFLRAETMLGRADAHRDALGGRREPFRRDDPEVRLGGVHERAWEDFDVVEQHRRFLEAPEGYLRHLRCQCFQASCSRSR